VKIRKTSRCGQLRWGSARTKGDKRRSAVECKLGGLPFRLEMEKKGKLEGPGSWPNKQLGKTNSVLGGGKRLSGEGGLKNEGESTSLWGKVFDSWDVEK